MARWDQFDYGDPDTNRAATVARELARLGVAPDDAKPGAAPKYEGARIFSENRFLKGSTLSSIGRNNGREDARGKHDLMLWLCDTHPRLQVQVKLYSDGHVEKLFLLDGEPFSHIGKAAHELEGREASTGKYPRPMWSAGDPEGDAAV